MENIVAELKNNLPMKPSTNIGDIVIIAAKKPMMLQYAIVTDIEHDETRKAEWWHVTMNLLTIPLQKITWTLRTPQFTGQETFTMGGETRFIQAIEFSTNLPPKKEQEKIVEFKQKNKLRIVK